MKAGGLSVLVVLYIPGIYVVFRTTPPFRTLRETARCQMELQEILRTSTQYEVLPKKFEVRKYSANNGSGPSLAKTGARRYHVYVSLFIVVVLKDAAYMRYGTHSFSRLAFHEHDV